MEMLDLSREHVAGDSVLLTRRRAGVPAPGGPGWGPAPGGACPEGFLDGSAVQSCLSWELPFILTLEGLRLLMAAEADFVLKGLPGWPRRPGLLGSEAGGVL